MHAISINMAKTHSATCNNMDSCKQSYTKPEVYLCKFLIHIGPNKADLGKIWIS